jgi:hypothetical protein
VKAIDEYLCARGDNQIKYVRCRVPADVRAAYPSSQTHITQSLGTSDLREAKSRVRTELARFEEEFEHPSSTVHARFPRGFPIKSTTYGWF